MKLINKNWNKTIEGKIISVKVSWSKVFQLSIRRNGFHDFKQLVWYHWKQNVSNLNVVQCVLKEMMGWNIRILKYCFSNSVIKEKQHIHSNKLFSNCKASYNFHY